MRFHLFVLMFLAIPSCASHKYEPASQEQILAESETMELDHVGPCIHGSVTTKHGVPVANAPVRAYGGFATRWHIGQTITDADGRYQLCGLQGASRIKNDGDEEWQLYIGVCVGDSGGQNPAAVLPWKDVQLPNKPDAMLELNFNCSLEEIVEIE